MKIAIGIYALLLFVGGVIGYMTAQSMPSLIMGTSTALMFAILACRHGMAAYLATVILTALLGGFFGYRFFLTGKFVPSGFMAIVSLLLIMWLIRGCFSSACCKSDTGKDLK
jgi:uncharacterized membrane protein (UPF0136 family)